MRNEEIIGLAKEIEKQKGKEELNYCCRMLVEQYGKYYQ